MVSRDIDPVAVGRTAELAEACALAEAALNTYVADSPDRSVGELPADIVVAQVDMRRPLADEISSNNPGSTNTTQEMRCHSTLKGTRNKRCTISTEEPKIALVTIENLVMRGLNALIVGRVAEIARRRGTSMARFLGIRT